ncbi:MAG: beta-lactamase family protein, partial [Selenomonadaceae bacterium]|nr:beta-lactamase family protein [Selenomonadaceae bacterium]
IFGVMRLVEQGKLNLDEDVGKYLGFELRNPNQPQKKITVRMLASHTSSLRDGKIYSIPPNFSVEEFFSPHGQFWENGAHFAQSPEKIGEYFTYSNLNYGLLGTIIERVTNQRFDLWQRENLFEPLDIRAEYLPGNLNSRDFEQLGTVYQKKNSAGIWNEHGAWFGKADDYRGVQPPKDTVRLQNPYAENFQGDYSLKDYHIGTNATIFSPQGGLRISFDELARALEMLMNGGIYHGRRILSRESLNEIFKAHWTFDGKNGQPYGGVILNYGLGTYFIDGTSNARVCREHVINLLGHTGAAFGLLSGIFFRPATKDGFIYMLNGTAIDEDFDSRSRGQSSTNYIWEEKIMNSICADLV